jgi:hypothetical protein
MFSSIPLLIQVLGRLSPRRDLNAKDQCCAAGFGASKFIVKSLILYCY